MTTLYYAPGACSLAAHIALEEAGAPYDTVRLDLAAGDQRAPEYLAINERGRVPALVAGDWVLTENSAILRHVARAHPEARLWPEDLKAQAVADEWLCWLSINHHPAYAHIRRPERYSNDEAALPGIRAKAADTFGDLCTMTEVRLSNGGWAVQDRYSVVDAYLMVFWVWARGPTLRFDMPARFPSWTAHARTMAERPAVQAVFAREGLPLPA
ncbi:glutathione S-transferase [Methylobacterium sp. WL30]|uniref:glutathione S-transferase family protein n=1 Tax=unclassified Methylobacterium TaxID=2615210 RepID=UPI0011CC42C6|nr:MULTISPECIES: glutathione S-transferase [unclassified Methylobacterium]RZK94474.1 MAG: glutathione S-transferase [Methylobacterium sp.]TXM91151.1 glutathione S-transferase [Methylobacterium sp. WL116]TXN31711.1 glutathione S-transferase [Methylobacterium sp. WL93]TXN46275.1 glutathione S-transferase [Methylobacterium sp. WL119]TXN69822.1 glutathione S-transferase [Methylobacterium sp. WL30]